MAATKVPSWKKQSRAWHKVTPPSGMTGMELRIPALTDLIRNEAVPERLRALALRSAAHPNGLRGVMADQLQRSGDAKETDAEQIAGDSQLKQAIDDVVGIQKQLICECVRVDGEPLTPDDLDDPEFPAPDAEWLGAVMLREAIYDARGVRLGIEPLDAWERFRVHHGCDPSCGSCKALQDEFSSVDLGAL